MAEIALKENLVSKEQHETLTEFQAKVDRAKMEGPNGDDELIWVETTPAICRYFCRQGLGKAQYFDYQGVKVCENGKSEELRTEMARQIGDLVHKDAAVNQVTSVRPVPSAPTR